MGKKIKGVDSYIAKAQDFAKPILIHLRELVHEACPDTEEKIKWGFPNFDYKGMLCSMAAFKAHATFQFWLGGQLKDPHKVMVKAGSGAMGQFGRITSIDYLPSKAILTEYIHEAMALNDQGKKLKVKPKSQRQQLEIPDYFIDAIKADSKALKTFRNFSYSHQKEYVEWVTEAKTEATRNKRLNTTIEWLAEGKARNWKYQK